ncbi:MAG: hypothetical protein E3K37_14200 [Candidatus Kuenenia sp.]|nr:hypothetical protein [Candidatus Kuenenia hertensis]
MEIGILQLIWFVIIIVIFLVSILKHSLNRKSKERLPEEKVRNRQEPGDIHSKRQKMKPEWQDLLDTVFGNERLQMQTGKEVNKTQGQDISAETVENDSAERKAGKSGDQKIPEFHAAIEDQHLKSDLEKNILKPSIQGQHIYPTLSEFKDEYKKITIPKQTITPSYKIHRKGGPKDAIIYSEIIAPPLGLREKRSLFRYRR